jgi:mannonate dehydratase
LDDENFQFAAQAGCSDVVIHLVDYFRGSEDATDQPIGSLSGWGEAGDPEELWSFEDLRDIRERAERWNLRIAAIENFDPAHWSDVLLGGPRRDTQLEGIKTLIRRVGRAGIPCIGYNFSIAGVAGRTMGPYARGDALSVGMEGPVDTPVPRGMAWNMRLRNPPDPEPLEETTHGQLWERVEYFLRAVIPVAEEAGVVLAAHPDDPPLPSVRSTPRLVHRPDLYQKLIDLVPSPNNQLEYCLGTLGEMTEGDVYDSTRAYARQGKIAYVHCRNVSGKVPFYRETFIDEGALDIPKLLEILHEKNFGGVVIPDHSPRMACDAPWHAGMAFALGYLRASIQRIEEATQ